MSSWLPGPTEILVTAVVWEPRKKASASDWEPFQPHLFHWTWLLCTPAQETAVHSQSPRSNLNSQRKWVHGALDQEHMEVFPGNSSRWCEGSTEWPSHQLNAAEPPAAAALNLLSKGTVLTSQQQELMVPIMKYGPKAHRLNMGLQPPNFRAQEDLETHWGLARISCRKIDAKLS